MNTKKVKTIRTLIVVIVCSIITIGVTVGICCYNYYGYINYKKLYLEDYFDQNEGTNLSTQEKIQKAVKWDADVYTDKLNIKYRDPITKEFITENKVSNDEAENVNAYYENYVLHLPKYFDINFYKVLTSHYDKETKKTELSVAHYFYFSNINYNQIKDFSPQYIYMTFVDGIGEESDLALQEALDEMSENELSVGNVSSIYYYSLTSSDSQDVLATYSLYDNPRDIYEDDEDNEDKSYYIYQNRCAKSYDNNTVFGQTKELTFCVYYINDSEEGDKELINIIEGTFTPELNDEDEILTNEEFKTLSSNYKGYNKEFYQDSYNEFIRPKIIKTGLLTFGITLLLCGLLAFIWLYEPKATDNSKSKSTKKNR